MRTEYTKTNSERIFEDIYLHDAMLSKLVWDYQDRFVSVDIANWERNEVGCLSFYGVVYMEASALGLWNGGVEYPIYLDCIFSDSEYLVSNVFADCVQKSKSSPETCTLPEPDDYFCVAFGTNAGDLLRFVVKKVVWEVPANPAPLFNPS